MSEDAPLNDADPRDAGYATEESEERRQAYAQACLGMNSASNAGQIIGAYQRTDYDVRSVCLEAATRVPLGDKSVVEVAREFYQFLTEIPAPEGVSQ